MSISKASNYQTKVPDDDDGGQCNRLEVRKNDVAVKLPASRTVDAASFAQLLRHTSEAREEHRHHVSGELPYRDHRDRGDAPVDVDPPAVLQGIETDNVEEAVEARGPFALVRVEQPAPHDTGSDEGDRH